MPIVLEGKDVALQSPTGSGKTLAYLIPTMLRIDFQKRETQALIIVPTRELAVQTYNIINHLCNFGKENKKGNRMVAMKLVGCGEDPGRFDPEHVMDIRSDVAQAAMRGIGKGERDYRPSPEQLLENVRPHIVVGTPQILSKMTEADKPGQKGALHMEKLRAIVMDEADALLKSTHSRYVQHIVTNPLVQHTCQTVFVSATMAPEIIEGSVPWMGGLKPRLIHADPSLFLPKSLTHHICAVNDDLNEELVYRYKAVSVARLFRIKHLRVHNSKGPVPTSVILFVNENKDIPKIAAKLRELNVVCDYISGTDTVTHSRKDGNEPVSKIKRDSKKDRKEVIASLEKREIECLIASDVMSRGVDIRNVTHVINWDVPNGRTVYTHRAGRVGRLGGLHGHVITLAKGKEISKMTPWLTSLMVEPSPLTLYKRIRKREARDVRLHGTTGAHGDAVNEGDDLDDKIEMASSS